MAQSTIVSLGNTPTANGGAWAAHVFYDSVNSLYWAFTLRDTSTTTLYTYSSPDGSTWTARATATLTKAPTDGRNLAVTYKAISGTAVVHVIYFDGTGGTILAYHLRGTISGTTISWGSSVADSSLVSPGSILGVAVCLDSNNKPLDWWGGGNNGDVQAFYAANADSGTSWTTGMGSGTDAGVGTNNIASGCLIPLSNGNVVTLCDDGGGATFPTASLTNVHTGKHSSSGFTASGSLASVFTAVTAQNTDTWNACYVSDTAVHCVLASGTNTWTEKLLNGSSTGNTTAPTVSAGATIGTQTFKATGGVALNYNSTTATLYLFCIDSATGNDIRVNKWTSGGGWAGWSGLGLASATRNYLSCAPQLDGSGNVQLYWVEGSASPFSLCTTLYATATNASATAALTLNSPILAAAAAEVFSASGGLTLSAPSVAAQGVYATAAAGLTLASPSVAATAAEVFTATAGLTLSTPALAAAASELFTATAALALASPSVAAQASYETASGGLTLASPIVAATAAEVFSAAAALALSSLTLAAQGSYTTAAMGLTLSSPLLAATATALWPATAALTLASVLLAAQGEYSTTAAGLTLASPQVAAAAAEIMSAAAALTLASPALAGQAVYSTAAAALTLSTLLLAASATEAFAASAPLTLSAPLLAAVGAEILPATAALTLSTLLLRASATAGSTVLPGTLTWNSDTFTLAFSGALTWTPSPAAWALSGATTAGILSWQAAAATWALTGTMTPPAPVGSLGWLPAAPAWALSGRYADVGTLTWKAGSANAPLLHAPLPALPAGVLAWQAGPAGAQPWAWLLLLTQLLAYRRRVAGRGVLTLVPQMTSGARLPALPLDVPAVVTLVRNAGPAITLPARVGALVDPRDGTPCGGAEVAWPEALPWAGLYYARLTLRAPGMPQTCPPSAAALVRAVGEERA